jgi:glucose/arabinose dehydrogenase
MKSRVFISALLVLIVLATIYGGIFIAKYSSIMAPFVSDVIVEQFEEEDEENSLPLILPPDFAISVFAQGLEGPRVLTRDTNGVLVTSLTRAGKIVALPDRDGNGVADASIEILTGLNNPHGILFRCEPECFLYVAEEGSVSRYTYDAERMQASNKEVLAQLPTRGGGHFTRTLLEHPDTGELLISVGSSCNVCNESDPHRATILSLDEGMLNVYARGLRNSVFMAVHPVTGEIWATDNGRDRLGDDIPPDEVNIIEKESNYGWPICYGKNVHDTAFDQNTYIRAPCTEPFEVPSHIDIQAHSAPLGLAFIPEEGWPEAYWHDLLVAYHGSWNRSVPTGYKIMRFDLTSEGILEKRSDFISGWLKEGEAWGRPVDVRAEPGGILYISDDHGGVIYRATYTP